MYNSCKRKYKLYYIEYCKDSYYIDKYNNYNDKYKFDFVFEYFAFIMFENSRLEDMTNENIRQIESSEIKTTTNVDEILALIAKKPNANILLKNKEICKQVANRLESRIYELIYSSNRFYSRLDAVFITNALLDSKNSVLMIDEIDDILNGKTPKALIILFIFVKIMKNLN